MQFYKLLGQSKPKSSPFSLVSVVAPHLAKFLENLCLVLRRDPDPGVTDGDLYRTISPPGVDSDPPSFRRELHRVGKKIEKYLFDLALIADEISKALVNCNVEIDAVLGGTLAHKRACVVYCQGKIERSHF